MSFEWKKFTLDEISKEVNYGYTASATLNEVGAKFLRITDIVGDSINWSTVPYCEISENNIEKYKLIKGDIVIARTGATTGSTAIFEKDIKAVFASYLIRFRINPEIADSKFIAFVLKSPIWTEYVKSIIGGSAQPGANAKQFGAFEVSLPPPNIQQKIAEILSSLDDKIELNRQTNATLEAIAQTLFKEWFIVPNTEGVLPDGWREATIGELLETVSKTYKFGDKQDIIFLNTGDISEGQFLHQNYSEVATLPGQAKKKIQKDDILFSEIRPANKRYAYVNFDADEYVVSTKLMVLRSKKLSPKFLYFLITQPFIVNELQHLAESRSGTFPQITFDLMAKIKIQLPSENILQSFINIWETNFDKIWKNNEENQTLTRLRDSLLPKLLKGEIVV